MSSSTEALLRDCRRAPLDQFAKTYNQLVRLHPELATSVESNAYTRNVLANRLAAGDLRWLGAKGIADWEPACIAWLMGWASTSATLTALIPVVERAATEYPGCSWRGSIPGQLAVLGMPQLQIMTTRLLQLNGTSCDDPGVVEILTALYLVVGLRDQVEIPYAPARQIAERPSPDPEYVVARHNWSTPKPDNNWDLLKVAVAGPEEWRLSAADAWADDYNWRYGVLLGLDLLPTGPYLAMSRNFHFEDCGRSIAWTRRLGKVHWFEPEASPSILLDLERGHSPLVESLVDYCRAHGELDELVALAEEWLSSEAAERFAALI